MTAPTPAVRKKMYKRDRHQCAATGRVDALTHQHRRAVGMGGTKQRPSITDSLTLTAEINDRCERDLQTMALAYGWKVRSWVQDPADVPVFDPALFGWAVLSEDGSVLPVYSFVAAEMMREVYGEEWDQWMEEIDHETPNGLGARRKDKAQ